MDVHETCLGYVGNMYGTYDKMYGIYRNVCRAGGTCMELVEFLE